MWLEGGPISRCVGLPTVHCLSLIKCNIQTFGATLTIELYCTLPRHFSLLTFKRTTYSSTATPQRKRCQTPMGQKAELIPNSVPASKGNTVANPCMRTFK